MSLYHALIRTHHITSRKKVANLKTAAKNLNVSCLLCSGGPPGIMYVEGSEDGVRDWVATVQSLRYKDYQLVSRPSPFSKGTESGAKDASNEMPTRVLRERATVKEFGQDMKDRGIWDWWRKAMGYTGED